MQMVTNTLDTLIHVSSCPYLLIAEGQTEYIPGLLKLHKISAMSS